MKIRCVLMLLLGWSLAGPAGAGPFVAPGDVSLRHDLQLLADTGILRGPVTTWPLSWPDIARELGAVSDLPTDAMVASAFMRVKRLAGRAAMVGAEPLGIRAAGSYEPDTLRGFAALPREEAEAEVNTGWMGDHFAVHVAATLVADPDDGKEWRADGSYAAVNVGNVVFSAGYFDRWWGPGWDGSLILSTNARPVPALTIERKTSEAFETRWLSWLGPWRASLSIGQAEDAGLEMPDVRLLAARVNFRPLTWLEIALSRTAQWCGGDRECSLEVFGDLLIGRDNRDPAAADQDEPGNQMAGYDVRLSSPWRRLPMAVYTQWIGEDEAGGLPSKFLGLVGAETWFNSGIGSMRWHAEYADTACMFTRENPALNCAYRNSLYPQGYTHRGRVMGHSMDNDGRMLSLGLLVVRPDDSSFELIGRRIELNRDGGPHSISSHPADLDDVEFRYSQALGIGRLSASVGYAGGSESPGQVSGARGSLMWQQGF